MDQHTDYRLVNRDFCKKKFDLCVCLPFVKKTMVSKYESRRSVDDIDLLHSFILANVSSVSYNYIALMIDCFSRFYTFSPFLSTCSLNLLPTPLLSLLLYPVFLLSTLFLFLFLTLRLLSYLLLIRFLLQVFLLTPLCLSISLSLLLFSIS